MVTEKLLFSNYKTMADKFLDCDAKELQPFKEYAKISSTKKSTKEILWSKWLLGSQSPKSLIVTMCFVLTQHFGLRGFQEAPWHVCRKIFHSAKTAMASSTSHRVVFKFWVACNLVLHTRNEIVICGCVLSATGNFTHSIKNEEYSAAIGVTGYTALNDSPASLTKKIPQKRVRTVFALLHKTYFPSYPETKISASEAHTFSSFQARKFGEDVAW